MHEFLHSAFRLALAAGSFCCFLWWCGAARCIIKELSELTKEALPTKCGRKVRQLSILSRLFDKWSGDRKENSIVPSAGSNKGRSRIDPPRDVDLNSVEYIPLPPAPRTWEVDRRDEFHCDYEDPQLKNIFQAGRQGKHTKVIKLGKELKPEQLSGRVGEIVAEAYRDTIQKRLKCDQIRAAAGWAKEMLEVVPAHCTDTDKRRYNKILSKLEKSNIKHSLSPIEVPQTNREPLFKLSAKSNWTLASVKSLSKDERPDPAFNLMAFTADGALYGDRSGKSGMAAAADGVGALQKLDRRGKVLAERVVNHDIYRKGCGPKSAFCALMDSDGCLHIYNDSLSLVAEQDLYNDRRVREHFRTTATNYWGEFRSQVRAIDVNSDGSFFLFTLADEAWCCSMDGATVWGVRMPLNEGWVRAVGRSERTGPGAEVESALQTFGLTLPVDPKDIKQRYRVLALRHHPDHNPEDPGAHRRMQEINEAFQILTGVDPSTIDFEVEESEVTYFRRKAPDHVIEVGPIHLEVWGPSAPAQDWVYGASFSASGAGAFLATYSGKVVEVDGTGVPVRVYDVGTVPSQVVNVGNYLYFLTPTRLYVLEQGGGLVSLIDVFRQGRLLVTPTGFGFLDNKCFQWFDPPGNKIGEIITRDPIRALYDSDDGVVFETLRHRAIISGFSLFTSGAKDQG